MSVGYGRSSWQRYENPPRLKTWWWQMAAALEEALIAISGLDNDRRREFEGVLQSQREKDPAGV